MNNDIRSFYNISWILFKISRHPDRNTGDPQANDKFIKINEAYEVGHSIYNNALMCS